MTKREAAIVAAYTGTMLVEDPANLTAFERVHRAFLDEGHVSTRALRGRIREGLRQGLSEAAVLQAVTQ